MSTLKRSLILLSAGVLLGWSSSNWIRWARQQLLQWLWPLGPLKLERPLVCFDIESTGLNVSRDRVLEIAAVKVWPGGKVEVKGPQRLNPRVHIPAEVTAIHHITQADLEGCPSFADVAQEWRDFMEGCDLVGYNAKKFDVPIIRNEFRRCGHFNFPPLGVPVVDAFRIFCQQEPRTLSAAVRFYCGRDHSKTDAHSALGDAWATLKVLVEQVRRYGDLPREVPELSALCARPGRAQDITPDSKFQWRGEQPIVAFGKHSGEPLAVLIARHRDHLMWMSGQDWGDETLLLVAQALKGLLPTKEGGWQPLFDTPPPDPANNTTPQQPPPAAAAAAPAGGSTSSKGSSEVQQQTQETTGAQNDAAAEQQVPTNNTAPPSSTASSSSRPNAAQPSSRRAAAAAAAPPLPPPEFTGWPELNPGGVPAQNPDSWGIEPSTVADGWSLLETVAYEGNPQPQATTSEPEEGWDNEAGGSQQQQEEAGGWEQGEQQEQDGWEEEEEEQQQQQGLGEMEDDWQPEQQGEQGGGEVVGEQQQQQQEVLLES